jgi:hypothetical protein
MAVICKVDHCHTLVRRCGAWGRPTDVVGKASSVFIIARTIADRPSTDIPIPNYIFYFARAMIIIRNFDLIVLIGGLIPLFDVHLDNILIFDALGYFLLGCPGACCISEGMGSLGVLVWRNGRVAESDS